MGNTERRFHAGEVVRINKRTAYGGNCIVLGYTKSGFVVTLGQSADGFLTEHYHYEQELESLGRTVDLSEIYETLKGGAE